MILMTVIHSISYVLLSHNIHSHFQFSFNHFPKRHIATRMLCSMFLAAVVPLLRNPPDQRPSLISDDHDFAWILAALFMPPHQ